MDPLRELNTVFINPYESYSFGLHIFLKNYFNVENNTPGRLASQSLVIGCWSWSGTDNKSWWDFNTVTALLHKSILNIIKILIYILWFW